MLASLALVIATMSTTTLEIETVPQDARMDWWREARFGMFIHWGLYAVPAGEWGEGTDHGEWIRTTGQIPVKKYDEFVPQFNPVKFDAEAWVRMARDAGMKYIVITSKHHDGFALFDSKVSEFDIMATPFKRDIMKELAAACQKYGIKMCWYHSIMDWHHPDYLPRRNWEDRPSDSADFERYVKYLHAQVTELLSNYGDIGVMWFDGEWEATWNSEFGEDLYHLCRRLQPNVIVNNRVTVGRAGMQDANKEPIGDYGTPEQTIPAEGIPGLDWETCMTMGRHWGYNKRDTFKSPRQLVHNLIDIASKGGNYLLNVGPKADGTFPDESVAILKNYAVWMGKNSESIYGTQASPLGTLPWGRCTTKQVGDKWRLYLHVFDWPTDGKLTVPLIGNEESRAWMLDGGGALTSNTIGTDIVIDLPGKMKNEDATVIVLELDKRPIVYKAPTINATVDVFVDSLEVTVSVSSEELEVRYTLDGSDPQSFSELYTGPVTVSATGPFKVRAFHNGRPVSDITERRFKLVEPKPAVERGKKRGLVRQVFMGDWNSLPDFDSMEAAETGTTETVELGQPDFPEYIGLRLSGTISVPEDGVFVFGLTSDDGARLWIDGELAVDNDGLHGAALKTGAVALAKGAHTIRVDYFNKTGGSALRLTMAAAGGELAEVPSAAYRH